MELRPLCRFALRYDHASWHRPYAGDQGQGFGAGTGTVDGPALTGTLLWSNHAHRREDGVWCPSVRGYVTTSDGAEVLVAIDGVSVLERAPDVRRSVLATVAFTTSADAYRWLNTAFVVGEGEFSEVEGGWWLQCHLARNELVAHPPAIGVEPPLAFRPPA
ncbi:DUF3237 domain-containing protein [Jatrophihabitans fulvus]